jgi:hypothetical protein
MTNILIGTPCYNGLVTTEYLISMLRLQNELSRQGIEFALETTTTVSLIPVARNYIVSQLLAQKKFTHLLFLDADLRFEPQLVARYVAANKDVVAGIYPVKDLNWPEIRQLRPGQPLASTFRYAVTVIDGEHPNAEGLVRAEYAATGFMLIRREVLEQMAAAYPDLKYRSMFALGSGNQAKNDFLYALFDTSLDHERGLFVPEDYTFCKRWRALGGEIWVDAYSKLAHVGPFAYEGDFSVFVSRP